MRLDDGAADRQADSHALGLRRDEGLEQLGLDLGRNPAAGIGHAHQNVIVARRRGNREFADLRSRPSPPWRCGSGSAAPVGSGRDPPTRPAGSGSMLISTLTPRSLAPTSARALASSISCRDALRLARHLAAGDEGPQPADDLAAAQRLLHRVVHRLADLRRDRARAPPAAAARRGHSWRWRSAAGSAHARVPPPSGPSSAPARRAAARPAVRAAAARSAVAR